MTSSNEPDDHPGHRHRDSDTAGPEAAFTVPEPLRCSLGGRSNMTSTRSDIGCPRCDRSLFRSEHELRFCIDGELNGVHERHARYGTVVVRLR